MRLGSVWKLLKDTVAEWQEDKVSLWAAALAYYTVFSLAPILIIAIAIAGAVFGQDAAQGQLVQQIQGLVGRQGAEAVQAMLQNANKPGSGGTIATVISAATLIFGASGAFGQLQDALNTIWEVKPDPKQGVKGIVRTRFISFAMVLVIGFLLMVSLVLSAVLAIISNFFSSLIPGIGLGQILNFIISFGVTTLLFALIYKVLPDVKIPWRDLWVGAAFTSLLFSIGRFLIGFYLGSGSVSSAYGAAGSLIVVLLWVYYSAQIILFGAEFTQVYAKMRGSNIVPDKHAIPINSSFRDRANLPSQNENDGDCGSGVATRSSSRKEQADFGNYVVRDHDQSNLPSHNRDDGDSRFDVAKRSSSRAKKQPNFGNYVATFLGSFVAVAGVLNRSQKRPRRKRR